MREAFNFLTFFDKKIIRVNGHIINYSGESSGGDGNASMIDNQKLLLKERFKQFSSLQFAPFILYFL